MADALNVILHVQLVPLLQLALHALLAICLMESNLVIHCVIQIVSHVKEPKLHVLLVTMDSIL